jgi:hypothetical protein
MAANNLSLIFRPQRRLSSGVSPCGFHGFFGAFAPSPRHVHKGSDSLPIYPSNRRPQDPLEVVAAYLVEQIVQRRFRLGSLLVQKRQHLRKGPCHAVRSSDLHSPSASVLRHRASANPARPQEFLHHPYLTPRLVAEFQRRKKGVRSSPRGSTNAYASVAIEITCHLSPRLIRWAGLRFGRTKINGFETNNRPSTPSGAFFIGPKKQPDSGRSSSLVGRQGFFPVKLSHGGGRGFKSLPAHSSSYQSFESGSAHPSSFEPVSGS